ncbi:MAG: hypothetical protein FWF46_01120 [Oscillospiraceae bacterium]|nr:hypothetical protein [Oscillospiraceae bacterium]
MKLEDLTIVKYAEKLRGRRDERLIKQNGVESIWDIGRMMYEDTIIEMFGMGAVNTTNKINISHSNPNGGGGGNNGAIDPNYNLNSNISIKTNNSQNRSRNQSIRRLEDIKDTKNAPSIWRMLYEETRRQLLSRGPNSRFNNPNNSNINSGANDFAYSNPNGGSSGAIDPNYNPNGNIVGKSTNNEYSNIRQQHRITNKQTGYQLLDGAIKDGLAKGITSDEISNANKEINQAEKNFEQPQKTTEENVIGG